MDVKGESTCILSKLEECNREHFQSLVVEEETSTKRCDVNVKVPIFVLHPSGTHYIPMCIDSSIVSHAFNSHSNLPRSSPSRTEQTQCHPVSIPVNFNPMITISDPYELDVQNINVIATGHQTSIRPS